MISTVSASGFKAVPYLETSLLMQNHAAGVRFSKAKVNVIVGPNGAGKSALLSALALQTLSWYSGETTLDDNYVRGRDSDTYWSGEHSWCREYEFLKGLVVKTDNAPALYYRPGHIPGNEEGITTAMMCGYFDQAKEFAKLTEKKSSGQKSQALLAKVDELLCGKASGLKYRYANWSGGKELKDVSDWRNMMPWDYTSEILKKRANTVKPDAVPLVLMDEPEQSLDALAEMRLWKALERVDCSKVQVIVATHSLYPIINARAFKIIEAVPGYAAQVRSIM